MRGIIITLALVALLITAGCTQIESASENDVTGDKTADELADDLSEAEDLDSELEDMDDFNLDELEF